MQILCENHIPHGWTRPVGWKPIAGTAEGERELQSIARRAHRRAKKILSSTCNHSPH